MIRLVSDRGWSCIVMINYCIKISFITKILGAIILKSEPKVKSTYPPRFVDSLLPVLRQRTVLVILSRRLQRWILLLRVEEPLVELTLATMLIILLPVRMCCQEGGVWSHPGGSSCVMIDIVNTAPLIYPSVPAKVTSKWMNDGKTHSYNVCYQYNRTPK